AQPLTGRLPGAAAWARDGRHLPAPGSSPAAVAAIFARTSASDRQDLVRRYPLVLGNLDGAPLELRYQANRLAAKAAGPQYAALAAPDRRLLAFDPRGRGLVAEVFGDLDRARRIAVLVPGDDTDAHTYLSGASSLERAARTLYAATGDRVAVVAWADYVTPRGLGLDAATERLGAEGAHRLVRLLSALPRPASLLCHSYGSVVCGLAARELPAGTVPDLVAIGSPGMHADRAAQLTGAARVWAVSHDSGEWIGRVSGIDVLGLGHGTDPTDPSFGARLLPSTGAVGHSGYFAAGTASLAAMARVALTGDAR
ncbi:alpha/beta hydrolase, partial [Streptacidiphilus monticola]